MWWRFPWFALIPVRVLWTILGTVAAAIISALLTAAAHIPFSGPGVAILAVVGGIASFFLSGPTDRDHAQNRPTGTWTEADQQFNELLLPSDLDAKYKARQTSIVEVMSFIVVGLTFLGMVVGITFQGRITGAILPVATTLWFALYMWMVVTDQKDN
jgi:hypothetical protein